MLEMKHEVRSRATFFHGDSLSGHKSGPNFLGTPEHFAHILDRFTDEEFVSAAAVARGVTLGTLSGMHPVQSAIPSMYTETHYHGPLVLDRDVEAVRVPSSLRSDASMTAALQKFAARRIEVKYF